MPKRVFELETFEVSICQKTYTCVLCAFAQNYVSETITPQPQTFKENSIKKIFSKSVSSPFISVETELSVTDIEKTTPLCLSQKMSIDGRMRPFFFNFR